MLVHEQLTSGPSVLDLRIATAASRPVNDHVLLLVHGLPRQAGMGRHAAGLLPELAEHLSNESGWMVATGTFSGVGGSTGTFSLGQWRRDFEALLGRVASSERRLSVAAFGFGGSLSLLQAAVDERIRGVATFSTPAHLDRWMGDAAVFRQALVRAGVVDPAVDLPTAEELDRDFAALDVLAAAAAVVPRRLLVGHGTDDHEVNVSEARELVAAADGRAELRIIQSAGHALRADPRMVATLLGWLDRHR